MEVVYWGSSPETDETVKNYIDVFLSNGWSLIKTEPVLDDKINIKYTVAWPEAKGKAVLPEEFKYMVHI